MGARRLSAREIGEWLYAHVVASDVLPREMPGEVGTLLNSLQRSLEQASSHAKGLFYQLCSEPAEKLLRGYRLGREEYYLLVAEGKLNWAHKNVGLSEYDDYEVFDMFFYEDEDRRCYINPELEPRRHDGRLRIRQGVCPEEIFISRLRSEQRRFFEKELPDVATRFKRKT